MQFRVLTLQVIGELILSLTPEESARVFPDLYLPIVEEANRRIWAPYRAYLPTPGPGPNGRTPSQMCWCFTADVPPPGWFAYNRTVSQLNTYLCNLIRKRWQERQVGSEAPYRRHR